jgi:hypothetical protein
MRIEGSSALATKIQYNKFRNQWSPRGIVGKSMNPFKANYSFEWIDENQGVGKVRVEIESRSFVENSWNYQWLLPEHATTTESITSSFDSPQFQLTQVFEIEIKGLVNSSNQNIFLRLKPFTRSDSAMTIVVPTQFEKTLDGVTKKSFAQSEKIQLLRKSLSSNGSHNQNRRIQF